jgi:hypothetical protein
VTFLKKRRPPVFQTFELENDILFTVESEAKAGI